MKNRTNELYKIWKNDFETKTLINSTFSFFITVLFALYNGFLGIYYSAVWNGSICFYYIFLVIIRGIIINSERKYREKADKRFRNKVHILTSVILLFMNLSLVAPIILMVLNKKEVSMSLIPAIAVAFYTTIKVVNASLNLKKTKKVSNKLVVELRYINFIEALVSILTLQNTLIAVMGESKKSEMIVLSTISSIGILIFIIIITLLNFCKRKTTPKYESSFLSY